MLQFPVTSYAIGFLISYVAVWFSLYAVLGFSIFSSKWALFCVVQHGTNEANINQSFTKQQYMRRMLKMGFVVFPVKEVEINFKENQQLMEIHKMK